MTRKEIIDKTKTELNDLYKAENFIVKKINTEETLMNDAHEKEDYPAYDFHLLKQRLLIEGLQNVRGKIADTKTALNNLRKFIHA